MWIEEYTLKGVECSGHCRGGPTALVVEWEVRME